jgi:chromatin segregation and condensation protein Rec8/ScpA/Scc1 (kleisin family)
VVEEKKLDILTMRLGDLADAYLTRVRALTALPADEVASFLALASRLVLLKARMPPAIARAAFEEDEFETEEELRARLVEYAVVRERAGQLGDRSPQRRAGVPPRRGSSVRPAATRRRSHGARGGLDARAGARIAHARRDQMAPGERYSVEDRTSGDRAHRERARRGLVSELLGPAPRSDGLS